MPLFGIIIVSSYKLQTLSNLSEYSLVKLDLVSLVSVEFNQKLNISLSKVLLVFSVTEPLLELYM